LIVSKNISDNNYLLLGVNILNKNVVSQYYGSLMILTCNNTTPSANNIWLFSSTGIYNLFIIDNTTPSKYLINSLNMLTIISLDFDDNGYYACGNASEDGSTFSSFSLYNLFVKRNL
jgi:hypothetical protein